MKPGPQARPPQAEIPQAEIPPAEPSQAETVQTETMQTETMHIGELAERTGLSLRTIRHYGDVGLLPASGRTEGGFRLYSAADQQRLMRIKYLKPLGFSLEELTEVVALLELDALDAEQRERAQASLEHVEKERAKLAGYLEQADILAEQLRDQIRH